MGNQNGSKGNSATEVEQKIVLRLRNRDIILHYSFKMKLHISDIALFPHGMEGLRLWDADIILSRFIILQNERFRNKSVFVFKAGVGIAGVTMGKWGGCKNVVMCDTKSEVVGNMARNCQRNGVTNVSSILINLAEFSQYSETYDYVLNTDLFAQGFPPQIILNIWRKVLKIGGQSIMIIPEKKEEAKKLLQVVDREEFRINNMILTAEQYEASPLFNKIQGESQFPLLGKTNFYAIILTKLKEKTVKIQKKQFEHAEQQPSLQKKKVQQEKVYKTPERKNIQQKHQQSKVVSERVDNPVNVSKNKKDNQRQNEKIQKKQQIVYKQQVKQVLPLSHQTNKMQQKKQQYQSPVSQLRAEEENQQQIQKQEVQNVISKEQQNQQQQLTVPQKENPVQQIKQSQIIPQNNVIEVPKQQKKKEEEAVLEQVKKEDENFELEEKAKQPEPNSQ